MIEEKIKYDREKFDTENEDKNTTLYITSEMIENNSHILEVGCSTGYFSMHLMEDKNCKLFALDICEQSVRIAKEKGINAILADVENSEFETAIRNYVKENGKFDYIIANDVIEHLKSPEGFLQKIKEFLKEDGNVIISVPNIAYILIRLQLLFGNFNYTQTGILDNTHLKFFTIKSLKNLIKDTGYEITELKNVYRWHLRRILKGTESIGLLKKHLHPLLKKCFDGLYAYQIVAKVKVKH